MLPAVGSAGIPLTTVNVDEVWLTLLRITDGNLLDEVMGRRIGRNLDGYDLHAGSSRSWASRSGKTPLPSTAAGTVRCSPPFP